MVRGRGTWLRSDTGRERHGRLTGMATDTTRSVELTRREQGHYVATNSRGDSITIGTGQDASFTPVELLLAAVAGCSAADVDFITGKRAEPTTFDVTSSGEKISDDQGNRMTDLALDFDVEFPADASGDRAREALERSIKQSRDRLCTVGRTVQTDSPIAYQLAGHTLS